MQKSVNNYLKFLVSLAVMGFGISLVTKSNLGTSAVSSVPYVLSRIFTLSFGTFTFIINMLYFFIQLVILNKNFPKAQYFQIIVGPVLGIFIDLSMYLLTNLNLNNYFMQIIILLAGCLIIAYSILLQLEADVVINPTEGIVKVISDKTKIKFSAMKSYFDIFLVVVSAFMSYLALNRIVGIREGTLISAFVVGYFIKLISMLKKRG